MDPTQQIADPLVSALNAPATSPPFFAVSIRKLVLISICKLGLFELYWFYKHWAAIRTRESSNISPAARAVLAFFFCYALFRRVRDFKGNPEVRGMVPAGALTTGWIVATLCWTLSDPYWLISMLAFVFLIPVQYAANSSNAIASPAHKANSRLTRWNWLVVVPGGLLVLLAVAGTILPKS